MLAGMERMHPMAMEIIKRTAMPKFCGDPMDLPKFRREWDNYIAIMRNCSAIPITDFVVLHTFKDCLQGGWQRELRR